MSFFRSAGWALLLVVGISHGAERPNLQGRPVADALRTLSGPDLQFIFSSQLLPQELTVGIEPSGPPLAQARAILADHGLGIEAIQPGLWAVVRLQRPDNGAGGEAARTATETLAEVVVSASRYSVRDLAASLSEMDADALHSQPGLGDDPIRALQRLPGLAHDGVSARSHVRGGEASETLMLLDGYPLRQAYHLNSYQSLFSVLDSDLIRGADIYTGGFPARYGNRMSGVFDLHSAVADDIPNRSLALDFFNASARLSNAQRDPAKEQSVSRFRLMPTDWLAAARVGTLKPLLESVDAGSGSPSYSDGFLSAAWGAPDTLRVTANTLLARDELTISDEQSQEHAQLEGRSRYYWLRADRDWGSRIKSSVWLGQTRLETVRNGDAAEPLIAVGIVNDRRSAHLTDFRGQVDWDLNPSHLLQAGFEYIDEDATYEYLSDVNFSAEIATLFDRSSTQHRQSMLRIDRQRTGVFGSWRWRLSEDLVTEIGGRAQRILTSELAGEWISEPRVGLRWHLGEGTNLLFNWGWFHQVDEINELQVEDGVQQFPAPQRSEHYIIGLEHEIGPRLSLRAEAFRKLQSRPRARHENIVDSLTILPEIAPDRVTLVPLSARVDGLEVSVNYHGTSFTSWGVAGISRASDEFAGGSAPRAWDQSWSVSGGLQWRNGPWQLGTQAELHHGWPRTPLLHESDGTLLLGNYNSTSLPTYIQIDLRAQYTKILQVGSLDLTAELMNAQVHRNECCSEFYSNDGQLDARKLYWLPVVPSLGVRWNF